jgi:hypothetical protein
LPAPPPRLLSKQQVFRRSRISVGSVLISCYVCILILTGFVATSDRFLHWFIVPVLLCGILIGMDAVDWLRSRLDVFDPAGFVGLLEFHFFFLAPLLHVSWSLWTLTYVVPPPDWRDWLGGMAFLNALGFLVYHISRSVFVGSESRRLRRAEWRLDRQRFFILVSGALLITGFLQIWVYAGFGGILGYIQTVTDFENPGAAMQGMGWIFMISESFPILALMAFAAHAERRQACKSWPVIVLVLIVYFVLKMLFGGFRGSRSNTIWGLMWAVGIVHFWLRPISKKLILTGCIFLVLFMYFYGFFKSAGLQGLQQAFEGADVRAELQERTGRSLKGALLGDLGRSDVQAFLLYRTLIPESDYEYAWGRTYVAALALLIPRSIWPERPPTKVKEGTEVQRGRGSYIPGVWESSKVYGLAGETMLNFGPIAVPFSFLIIGFVVGYIRRLTKTLEPTDSRWLLLPFLVTLCFVILAGDLDNILFYMIKNGSVPFAVLALSSRRIVAAGSMVKGL